MFTMMQKGLLALTLVLLLASGALAYNKIDPAEVKASIESGAAQLLVDIQVEDEFAAHHLPGAIATYAYPVKSESDEAKLAAVLDQLDGDAPVVVVCPRGGGGAKRAYDYLEEAGIPEERLFILSDGQQGWPFPELVQSH